MTDETNAGQISSGGEPVSAFSLLSKSWEIVKNNLSVFGILAIPAILSGLANIGMPKESTSNVDLSPIQSSGTSVDVSGSGIIALMSGIFIVVIIFSIIALVIQTVTYVAQLRAVQGSVLSFDTVWKEARPMIWPLFALSAVIGFAIIIGFVLFIIPGFIMIRRYSLAPYIMVDKKLGIRDSMKASADLTLPYSMAIYKVLGLSIVLALVPAIIPIIGGLASSLITFVYALALPLRYEEFKKLRGPGLA